MPSQWRMAQVAQDMPETDESATDFVIAGDTLLAAAQAEVTAAEDSDDGERMAHAYMALHDAGAHDAQSRAQALILGLGLPGARTEPAGQQLFRRLAHATAAGARADVSVRPAAARRTDQPPRSRRAGVAGSLAEEISRHHAGDQPRPRVSRCRDQRHPAHRKRPAHPLRRQLQHLRGHARRADGAAAGGVRQTAGQDRPPAGLHQPLQGQGQQGQAGAKPGQGAGSHGTPGADAGERGFHLRVQGTAQPAQPHADHRRRQLRLPAACGRARPAPRRR